MCGIVAAVSGRNIVPILVQGLQRLEYRGYDSCGVAVHSASLNGGTGGLQRARSSKTCNGATPLVRTAVMN